MINFHDNHYHHCNQLNHLYWLTKQFIHLKFVSHFIRPNFFHFFHTISANDLVFLPTQKNEWKMKTDKNRLKDTKKMAQSWKYLMEIFRRKKEDYCQVKREIFLSKEILLMNYKKNSSRFFLKFECRRKRFNHHHHQHWNLILIFFLSTKARIKSLPSISWASEYFYYLFLSSLFVIQRYSVVLDNNNNNDGMFFSK